MLNKKQFEDVIVNKMNNLIMKNYDKPYFNLLYHVTNRICRLLAKLGLMAKRIHPKEEN